MNVELHVIEQASPSDLSGLQAKITSKAILPETIVAVLGKTEGNGCVNDFTRGYTNHVLLEYFTQLLGSEAAASIVLIMSGGCEGVMTPHLNVFTRADSSPNATKTGGLTVLTGKTRDFLPEEMGRLPMVEAVAERTRQLLAEGDMAVEDLHFAQIKCPLLNSDDFASGKNLITYDTLKSMGFTRAASALGIAVATGELTLESLSAEAIGKEFDLYSSVASTSAGIELKCCEILLMGNSPSSTSALRIGHSVMQHALDIDAVEQASLASQPGSDCVEKADIVNIFTKAEPSPDGKILGHRHTMLQDSDISPTRMARSVVAAVVAAYLGRPMVYVSGGAEHQGPPGGGPVATISRIG